MRDYTLTRALSLGEIGGGSSISRLFHNWLTRRSIARLQTFDDYLLRDIGVAREDIAWAAGLPLTTNAALGLEERSRRRSGRR
jgi:uncharacterized protein YjiS (DUF1127 family)